MDILDSNILLHYIRESPLAEVIEARYALTTAVPALLISIVSEGELRALALRLAWGTVKRQRAEGLPDYLTIIPIPFEDVVETHAKIDDYSHRKGITMGKNDLWIAATAAIIGARLLTTDRDFGHLDGVYLGRDWMNPVL